MSGFASRSALIGSSFLVLALASPSLAQNATPYGQGPGFGPGAGQALMQQVHLRGEGRRGMIPVAHLVCGDDAAAKTAAFQAKLAEGLNLTAEQQDLVAQIIAAVTADEDQVARMCERLDRMAERGDKDRGWGRHGHGQPGQGQRGEGRMGWGQHGGHMQGHMQGHMHEEGDEHAEGDEQAHMQRPNMPGQPGYGQHGHQSKPGGWGVHAQRGPKGPGGPNGAAGPMGLERLLNNPALSDEDRAALEGIFEKLKTAAEAKQKARHALRGLMMDFRHSLSKEQAQMLRKGGFQQFLPDAPEAPKA